MNLSRSCAGTLLLATPLLAALAGCGNHVPPALLPDAIDPDAPKKAIELYDTNHDGAISGAEFDKVPGLKAALPYLDPNKTGKITAEDIAKRIAFWKESQTGRINVNCIVRHKKTPLAGATVRFVPEKFLGDGLQTGFGITSPHGVVLVKTHDGEKEIFGLSPGMYRVEITKAGESIPAKYNTATTLGVFVDTQGIGSGPIFDLDY
jgi:hypothetical protein